MRLIFTLILIMTCSVATAAEWVSSNDDSANFTTESGAVCSIKKNGSGRATFKVVAGGATREWTVSHEVVVGVVNKDTNAVTVGVTTRDVPRIGFSAGKMVSLPVNDESLATCGEAFKKAPDFAKPSIEAWRGASEGYSREGRNNLCFPAR